jgi:hypothetical protein
MDAVRCRACRAEGGDVVLDLGLQPACEYFPPLDDPTEDPVFPLRLWLCAHCGLAQLADNADLPDEPEGIEPSALRLQRHDAVGAAHAAGLLRPGASWAEGATPHGGSWADELAALGLHGADPGASADVVVDGAFGMMHATDQEAALNHLVSLVEPGGVLLFQFHTLAAILREQQWNAVRLGHYAYYSIPVVQRMLASRGLTVTNAWTFPLYGGTVLVAARRGGVVDSSVGILVADELAAGVVDAAALRALQASAESSTAALRALTQDARDIGSRVYGYGAASRSVALLYLADLQDGLLAGVADAAPAKHGCRIPGTTTPIVSPTELLAAEPDVVLLFVSDLMSEVRAELPGIEEKGGRWVDAGTGLTVS